MKKLPLIVFVILLLQITSLSLNAQTATISCPGNLTVSTDPEYCTALVNNIDPVVSPSTAAVNYTVSNGSIENGFGSASGRRFTVGINTVTYYLRDYPGVSCSFTIKVEDHTPPVITCPANITVGCYDEVPYGGGVVATDGCTPGTSIEIKLLGETRSNETCYNQLVLTRTYQATDYFGNSSTCQQKITVHDTVAPYFIQPPPISPITYSCPSQVPSGSSLNYTAIDECNPPDENNDITAVFKEVKTAGACENSYTLNRTWTAKDICGNAVVYTQVIHVEDKTAPVFDQTPNPSIAVNCASEIPEPMFITATDNCLNLPATVTMTEVVSEKQCANRFKLTRIWKATDACGNTDSVKQVIEVNDRLAPIFEGSAPYPVNVSCEKDIPAAVTQTAIDNCGVPTISFTEVKSNIQCANRFTLTRTWVATDSCGNKDTRVQVITVNDTEAPKITGISVDQPVLWPPNHKMKDVTINYTATDNCGVTSSLSVTSTDPINGGSDGDQAPDWEIIDEHHVRLRAEKANNGQARVYTIKITITDGCNQSFDTTVNVVVAHNITGPSTGHPFRVGSTVTFNGVYWDKPGNTHTAKWLLDGSTVTNGTVTEPSGSQNGKVSGTYKLNNPGVYKLQMNVIDQAGITSYANTNNDLDAIVVVYDPNGGNAYGGGWFNSQPGALSTNSTAEGKASYGFSVNYRNAAKPKGETQFEFKVGSFEFNALNFDYLSISGAKAQFRGTGKIIGGQSGIGFIMTVTDGEIDGSNSDKIRMKIYNRNTGYVYYDNQPGDGDAADPLTLVGTNSSVVIQGAQQSSTTVSSNAISQVIEENVNTVHKLDLLAYPNPSHQLFSIRVNAQDQATKIGMQVLDQQGRLIEKNESLAPGQVISLGKNFRPGVYYVRIVQGSEHREIKLVKLGE